MVGVTDDNVLSDSGAVDVELGKVVFPGDHQDLRPPAHAHPRELGLQCMGPGEGHAVEHLEPSVREADHRGCHVLRPINLNLELVSGRGGRCLVQVVPVIVPELQQELPAYPGHRPKLAQGGVVAVVARVDVALGRGGRPRAHLHLEGRPLDVLGPQSYRDCVALGQNSLGGEPECVLAVHRGGRGGGIDDRSQVGRVRADLDLKGIRVAGLRVAVLGDGHEL